MAEGERERWQTRRPERFLEFGIGIVNVAVHNVEEGQ